MGTYLTGSCETVNGHEEVRNCLLATGMKSTASRRASWEHLNQNSSPHDLSWGHCSQAPHSPFTYTKQEASRGTTAEQRLVPVRWEYVSPCLLFCCSVWSMSVHVVNEGGGCHTLGDRMTEPRNHTQTRKLGLPNLLLLKHCV